METQINDSLEECFKSAHSSSPSPKTVLTHLKVMPTGTLHEQVNALCSISNNHWWPFLSKDGKLASSSRSYLGHLLYNPSHNDTHGQVLPCSLRNQLMYFLFNSTIGGRRNTSTGRLNHLLGHVLQQDFFGIDVLSTEPHMHTVDLNETEPPPSKRRRKITTELSTDPQDVAEILGLNATGNIQKSVQVRSLYSKFSEDVISDSVLFWRQHIADGPDIVVMNDYCPMNGVLLPQKFVHLRSYTSDEGLNIACTCRTYGLIELAAKANLQRQGQVNAELTDICLSPKSTCMHCRFFREYLQKIDLDQLMDESSIPNYLISIQKNLEMLGNPLCYLGEFGGVTKYSVQGEDDEDFGVIHLNRYQNEFWAKCLSGNCQAIHLTNKKKIPKVLPLQNTDKLCYHLRTLAQNIDLVRETCNIFTDDNDYADEYINMADPTPDDEVVQVPWTELGFDIESGMWKAKAITKQSCKDMWDNLLLTKTEERIRCIRSENLHHGVYKGPEMIPQITECPNCKGEHLEPIPKYSAKVYTRNVSM